MSGIRTFSTMLRIFVLLLVFAACVRADENSTVAGSRQKRAMLFFDDDGHLMKSFVSPYLQQLAQYAASRPENEDVLKYFFNFLRPLIINTAAAAYMIPVSENVVQQINRDPIYQNKLTISKRGPEYNPLCAGMRTQIPSPNACNSFLSCWDGWAYELECPEGLMFSREGYCDYADMVQCQDRAVVVPSPVMPRCKTDFETFRNELNCNEFFVCVNRKPVKFQCPAKLSYSQKFGVCDYPELVDCSSTATHMPPSSIPQPSPPQPSPMQPSPPQPSPMQPSPPQPSPMQPSPEQPTPPQPTDIPTFPSHRPVNLFPRPSRPGSIANLPAIPSLPIQNIIDGPIARIPGGVTKPEEGEAPGFQFNPNLSDGNAIFMQNSIFNSHNFATPLAIMSPQDAVRYLKLNNLAEVKSS